MWEKIVRRFIFSEEERRQLIALIVHLHDDLEMGYRRIGKELVPRGFPEMGKDTVRKFYLEGTNQENPNREIESEELRSLRQREIEAERRARQAKETQRIQERIVEHKLAEITHSFDERRELFTRPEKAREVAEEIMPVIAPMPWTRFKEHCEKNAYDLAGLLQLRWASRRSMKKKEIPAWILT